MERLLPVEYFHVVFTLPQELKPLVLKNHRAIYTLLFRTASQTLLQLAADPKRLGVQIGFTAILHTWGQNLLFHPHLHCVATNGGLSGDGQRWISGRPGYFLPVDVLSALFRGKFLAGLKQAYQAGELALTGSTQPLADPQVFRQLLKNLYRKSWIVYAKRPFGGAEQVYRYLGRYTHRVAIANSRIVSFQDGRVCFRYKDYGDANRIKQMTLSAEEFIRRFLLHVLPKGFVRMRHYGLLASRNVSTRLERCRQLLAASTQPDADTEKKTSIDPLQDWMTEHVMQCPHCGRPLKRQTLSPLPSLTIALDLVYPVPILDSS
jgi:hypothetical protein